MTNVDSGHVWPTDFSQDDLCVEIGRSLASTGRPMRPLSRDELRDLGREWMLRHWTQLRLVVCKDSRVRALLAQDNDHLIFEATCEIVVHMTTGIPAGFVAAYLVKHGILNLCRDDQGSNLT
jgi:hypothetical protein